MIKIQITRIKTHTDESTVHKPQQIWNKRYQVTKYRNIKTDELTVTKTKQIWNKRCQVTKYRNIKTDEPTVHKPQQIWNKRYQVTKYRNIKTNRRTHSNEDKADLKIKGDQETTYKNSQYIWYIIWKVI